MYKLKRPTAKQLSDYYDEYGPTIQQMMMQLAAGTLSFAMSLGRGSTAVSLTQQVQNGSPVWQFLSKYAQEMHLRRLLCGDWNVQLNIIREVNQMFPNLTWQQKMTKEEYDLRHYQTYGNDAAGRVIVEDFNEIMHWLFVEKAYDGDKKGFHLDKTAYVESREMEVCPYCGRQFIDMAEVNNSVSKPYIDHFLPKSKYPFLAMSYMNLIPGCNVCNEASNKGTLDPFLHPNFESLLLNPHEFRDSAVTFSYDYNHKGENDGKNYQVFSDAENQYLEKGYLEELKLREFYSHRSLELKDMYRGFTKATGSMRKYLLKLGLKKFFIDDIELRTLGYNLNEDEAPRRLMYKFKKDLFEKMKQNYGL